MAHRRTHILMGLAFDQAGTVVDNLFVDGFETGDTSGSEGVHGARD